MIALAPERFAKDLWTERAPARVPLLVTVAEEADQARYVAARVLENREAGATLKSQAVLFRTSPHSAALELELTRRNIPFVKFGGLKFLDAAHVKDALALLRFAENPRDRVAGFRVAQLLPGVGPEIAEKIVAAAAADDGFAALAALPPPAKARAASPNSSTSCAGASRAAPWPAEIAEAVAWLAPDLEKRYDNARARDGRSRRAGAHRRNLSLARAFLQRADARSAGRDQRRGGPADARRRLSDPLDHPFGQGAGMEHGVRAQLRRRLHSLRSRDRLVRGDRGGAPAALCRDDPGARTI